LRNNGILHQQDSNNIYDNKVRFKITICWLIIIINDWDMNVAERIETRYVCKFHMSNKSASG